MTGKERLDILVQRQTGLSRAQAQGLILTGRVFGPKGEKLDKPGVRLAPDTPVTVREVHQRFVSRGGEKLAAAFEAFSLGVTGRVCIDVGASTGGFTDCMLQRGARLVYAVDVGYGQLDWGLRQDARVMVLERANIRYLTREVLDTLPDFFAVDCSFISLRLILPPLSRLLAVPAEGVCLVKPQFEAGRAEVGKGGVVKDPAVHERVLAAFKDSAASTGFEPGSVTPSPLMGPAGNKEYLAYLRYPSNHA